MPIRPIAILVASWLIVYTTSRALAQAPSTCACTEPDAATLAVPDTVFHVRPGFDVAFCGRIDRSVTPFVYSAFTMRTCGLVQVPVTARGALQECHLSISNSMFILDDLALLPTGADMHLERRPCWRTRHWLFVAEDSSAAAIGAPTTELIATFQQPTPGQVAQVQGRLDAMKPSMYWMDEELLGQVFLCALYDKAWASRFREMRETYHMGGAPAKLYDEFLRILHDRGK